MEQQEIEKERIIAEIDQFADKLLRLDAASLNRCASNDIPDSYKQFVNECCDKVMNDQKNYQAWIWRNLLEQMRQSESNYLVVALCLGYYISEYLRVKGEHLRERGRHLVHICEAIVKPKNGLFYALACGQYGAFYKTLGCNYKTSLKYLDEQLKYGRDHCYCTINAYLWKADIGNKENKFVDGLRYAELMYRVAKSNNSVHFQGIAISLIGTAHYGLGLFEKALENHLERYDIAKTMRDERGEGLAIVHIASIYSYLGAYDTATKFYQKFIDITKKDTDNGGTADGYGRLGGLYLSKRNYLQASYCFEEQLKYVEKTTEDERQICLALKNKAHAYLKLYQTRPGSQLEYKKKLHDVLSNLAKRVQQFPALKIELQLLFGQIHMTFLNYNESAIRFRSAYSELRNVKDDYRLTAEVLTKMGEVEMLRKNYDAAVQYLTQASNVWKKQLESAVSSAWKISCKEITIATNHLLIRALYESGNIEQAFVQSELGKCEVLRDTIRKKHNCNCEERTTIAGLKEIGKEMNIPVVSYYVCSTHQEDQKLVYVWILLPDGTLKSERILAKENTFIDIGTITSQCPHFLRNGLIRGYMRGEGESKDKCICSKREIPKFKIILASLYQLFWAPVAKHLPADASTVIVCTHRELCELPIGFLLGTNDEMLFKSKSLLMNSSLISAYHMYQHSNKPGANQVVGAVVDPSPFPDGLQPVDSDKKEMETLRKYLNEENILDGCRAVRERVLELLKLCHIFSITSHGKMYCDHTKPHIIEKFMNSGFAVCNEFIQAFTIEQLEHVPLYLAILASCETGRGYLTEDGVLSLVRAFVSVGARCVIGTLWQVPDYYSALLMAQFYENLFGSQMEPHTALQQALITLTHDLTPEESIKRFGGFFCYGLPVFQSPP